MRRPTKAVERFNKRQKAFDHKKRELELELMKLERASKKKLREIRTTLDEVTIDRDDTLSALTRLEEEHQALV
jgi:hypothetical protein